MGKHRLRNRIKSIVGGLIDPDKDEQLKGSNIATEDNYEKILEILKEENQEDKSKLVELIEEFHNRYKSVYDRYAQITGKLKERVNSKKEKESSSSSSSDSDSDNPSNKNGKLKDKINMSANTDIDELQRKLAVETEEKEALNSQLQETENMLSQLKLQSDRLLEENSKILAENRELNSRLENTKELEWIITQKQESDNLIERLRNEITNMNGDQERLLEEKDIHMAEIKRLEKKIEQMSQEIENGLQSKEQVVEQLEETIEDLKSDLEIKGDEVSTLTETVRNLEVKIRLSTQKLRVTEQMLSETEHDHATKEEKLHQENKSLVEKISTLSQTITDIKREVQDKVNETLTGVDSLTVKFEEDYGHVRTRVNEITNEIQATQVQLKQMKDDLKQKFQEMVKKLKFSEGENDRLLKSFEDMKTGSAKKDEKINELENTIHMKDECISGFCEDKREAIKQLCIWADYHRDRLDHLQQLLKTSSGAQRQTVR
ncbi:hypothetical protein L1987_56205 [Smallanthus sonchifolius]|uniref:Uncharacterized protein n=1 Tax=Smallanthus sonchifolius TaxID=185202 RepID=A0ACB9ECG8_9ASTR|nr:hypothetical protein L1987_56205 [Smallanthus sonchifolius]